MVGYAVTVERLRKGKIEDDFIVREGVERENYIEDL